MVDVDGLLRADHLLAVSFEPGSDVVDGEVVVGDYTARLWDRYGNIAAIGTGDSITDAIADLRPFTVPVPEPIRDNEPPF
ncbi:hypothetical protein [Nocardia takedensis]|uniref:hypothetical protein n=1 Tax=Nocardia takedensis TaxID=259390 RepID=UPI0002F0435D|nr:hypothetical protein [Nocardia takedensis]